MSLGVAMTVSIERWQMGARYSVMVLWYAMKHIRSTAESKNLAQLTAEKVLRVLLCRRQPEFG